MGKVKKISLNVNDVIDEINAIHQSSENAIDEIYSSKENYENFVNSQIPDGRIGPYADEYLMGVQPEDINEYGSARLHTDMQGFFDDIEAKQSRLEHEEYLESIRLKLQEAFEKQNAEYFARDFQQNAIEEANKKFYASNPLLNSLHGTSNSNIEKTDNSNQDNEEDFSNLTWGDKNERNMASFLLNLGAGGTDVLKLITTLGTDFRLPKFGTFFDEQALAWNPGATLWDKGAGLFNDLLDKSRLDSELRKAGLINNDKNATFSDLIGDLQTNPVAKFFEKHGAGMREEAQQYKVTNKTLEKDGWGALADPDYWGQTMAQVGGSLAPMMASGAGIGRLGSMAGLSKRTNALVSALGMTTVESGQIATQAATDTFKASLNRLSNNSYSSGEDFYIKEGLQKLAASGANLSDTQVSETISNLKDEYLKQYTKDNPDIVIKAYENANIAFSQASSFNSINILTNLTGANLIVNGFTRKAAQRPLLSVAGTLLRESAQEAYEEGVTNQLAEKSGLARGAGREYNAVSDIISDIGPAIDSYFGDGKKAKYSEATKDLFSLASLEQALAGAIGGFGMAGLGSVANYSELKDNYKKYKEALGRYQEASKLTDLSTSYITNTAKVLSSAEEIHEIDKKYNDAVAKANAGNPIALQVLESDLLTEQVVNANLLGTTKELINMYTTILNNPKATDSQKEAIKETLNNIGEIQKTLDTFHNSELKNVTHATQLKYLENKFKQNALEHQKVVSEARVELEKVAASYRFNHSSNANPYIEIFDEDAFTTPFELPENLTDNPFEKGSKDYHSYNRFLKTVLSSEPGINYNYARLVQKSMLQFSEEASKTLSKITTPEYQKMLAKEEAFSLALLSLKGSFQPKLDSFLKLLVTDVKEKPIENVDEFNTAVDNTTDKFIKKNKITDVEEQNRLKNIASKYKITKELTPEEVELAKKKAKEAITITGVEAAVITPEVSTTTTTDTTPVTETAAATSVTDTTPVAEAAKAADTTPVAETTETVDTTPVAETTAAIPVTDTTPVAEAAKAVDTEESKDKAAVETLKTTLENDISVKKLDFAASLEITNDALTQNENVLTELISGIDRLKSAIQVLELAEKAAESAVSKEHLNKQIKQHKEKLQTLVTKFNEFIEKHNNLITILKTLEEFRNKQLTLINKLQTISDKQQLENVVPEITELNKEQENVQNLFEKAVHENEKIKELMATDDELSTALKFTEVSLYTGNSKTPTLGNTTVKDNRIIQLDLENSSFLRREKVPFTGFFDSTVDPVTGKVTYAAKNIRSGHFKNLLNKLNGKVLGQVSIPDAHSNYLNIVSNPLETLADRTLGVSIDLDIVRSLCLNPEMAKYITETIPKILATSGQAGIEGIFKYLGEFYILNIPIKAAFSNDAYTYLIDDGYFSNAVSVSVDGKIYKQLPLDNNLISIEDFTEYKERTVALRKQILFNIFSKGSMSESTTLIPTRKTYGELVLLPVGKEIPTSEISDLPDADKLKFTIKVDNKLSHPIDSNTLVDLQKYDSGTIFIETKASNGFKLLHNLTPRKFNDSEAFALLELAKIIIDGNANQQESVNIVKDGKILIKGMDALTALTTLIEFPGTNRNTDSATLNIILKSLLDQYKKTGESAVIEAIKNKYSLSYNKDAINRKFGEALKNINPRTLANNAELTFFDITADMPYNALVIKNTLSNIKSLQRVNPHVKVRIVANESTVNQLAASAVNDLVIDNDILNAISEEEGDNIAFSTANLTLEQLEEDGTIPAQLRWLSENLPQLPASEYQHVIPLINDKIALGYFFTNLEVVADVPSFGIRYHKQQPVNRKGIIYHEAFHGVLAVLLTEKEYKSLIKNHDEEHLAEAFREFINNGTTYRDPRIQSLFKRILNYILTFLKLSHEYKVNKLFRDISTGKFKHTKARTERITKAAKLYSTTNTIQGYVAKELAKSLVWSVIDSESFSVLESATSKSIGTALQREFNIVATKYKENPTPELLESAKLAKTFLDLYNTTLASDPNNILVRETNDYIQSIIRVDLKNAEAESLSNSEVEEGYEDVNDILEISTSDDISKHTVDSNLFDYSLKAPKFIQVLLAAIPKLNDSGNFVFNKYTGLREFLAPRNAQTALLQVLQGSYNDVVFKENAEYSDENLAITKLFNDFKRLTIHKPEFIPLYKFLDNAKDTEDIRDFKKTMFYSAMALNKTTYLTTRKYITVDENTDIKKVNFSAKTPKTASLTLLNSWIETHADWKTRFSEEVPIITERGDKIFILNKEFRDIIDDIQKYVEAVNQQKNAVIKKFGSEIGNSPELVNSLNNEYNKLVDGFVNLVNTKLHVPITKRGVDYYVDSITDGVKMSLGENINKNYSLDNFIRLTQVIAKTLDQFIKSPVLANRTFADSVANNGEFSGRVGEDKFINAFVASFIELAESHVIFEDNSGSFIVKNKDNKNVYIFDYQSELQNQFNRLSAGNITAANLVERLSTRVEHSNSLYLEGIASKKIELVRLLKNTTVEDEEQTFSDGTSTSFAEDLLNNLHLTLYSISGKGVRSNEAYIRMLSFADKNTSDLLYHIKDNSFLKYHTVAEFKNGNIPYLTENTVDIFYNYYLSELERILDKQSAEGNNLRKNQFISFLFNELSLDENTDIGIKLATFFTQSNNPTTAETKAFIDSLPEIKSAIRENLSLFVANEISKFRTITDLNNPATYSSLISSYITDSKIYKFATIEERIDAAIADYIINSVIANIETTKLFTGSVAAYGNTPIKAVTNFLKRTPFITSKGQQAKVVSNSPKFNLAVIKSEYKESSLYTEEVIEQFRPLLEKERLAFLKEKSKDKTHAPELTEKDIKNIDNKLANLREAYTNLDTTDAQGYITLDRWYDLVKGSHKYIKQIDVLYNKLKSGNATFEDFKKAQIFLQPLKGVIYELNLDGRYAIPIEIKYSQFILTPQLVAGNGKLQEIYNKMLSSETDELVYDSASKGDFTTISNINDDKFSNISLNKWSWKLQVDFSAKNYESKNSLVGSQFVKNVWLNARLDENYDGRTGKQIISEITTIINKLSNGKAYGFYSVENAFVDFITSIKDIPLQQREALKNGADISMYPQSFNLIETSINSAIRKRITTLLMRGGAYIQASSNFFAEKIDVNNSNIRWLIDKKELTGSTVDKPAYVLLPYNMIENLTEEQLAEVKTGKIDPRVLKGIGYRIPNQPKASIDKIQIAGFLPKGYGDTIVVYDEGTKKFGYDFDVDKTYVLFPEARYNASTNSIDYVEGNFDEPVYKWRSQGALKNKLIENWLTLINGHLNEIIEPLDSEWLENMIRENNPKENYEGLNLFSPITQIQVKRNNLLAKELIGPFANLTSDMAANQQAKVYLPYKLGIGNQTVDGFIDFSQLFDEQGNLISNTALAYQNGAVDAAKNPFLIQGNINLYTADITSLLIKAGVSREFIVKLMSNPVFKEYSILQSKGNTARKAISILRDKYNSISESSTEDLAIKAKNLFEAGDTLNNFDAVQLLDSLQKLGAIDTNQTLITKIGVDGGGKTMADKIVLQEKIREMLQFDINEFEFFNSLFLNNIRITKKYIDKLNEKSQVGNFIYKFFDFNPSNNNIELTVLGNDYKNALLELEQTFGGELLSFSDQFKKFNRALHNTLGMQFATNKKIVAEALKVYYQYVFNQSFGEPTDLKTLLNPEKGLAARLTKEMEANIEFAKSDVMSAFIFETENVKSRIENGPIYNFRFINIATNKVKNNLELIREDFEQALFENKYGETAAQLLRELVQYSLHTDTSYSNKSFFHILPPSTFKNKILQREVNNDLVLEQLFRNNWLNSDIVPKVSGKGAKYYGDNLYLSKYSATINGVIKPFVLGFVRRKPVLFELESSDFNSTINAYKYIPTTPLGYKSNTGTIKQYGPNVKGLLGGPEIIPINPIYLNQAPTFKIINIEKPKEVRNAFHGKLVYGMPGSGKTELVKKYPNIYIDAETKYKELLGSDDILVGLQKFGFNNPELDKIHQELADWIKEKLKEGYTVFSGLKVLLDNATKLGLEYDAAIILENYQLFRDRTATRKENPIYYTIEKEVSNLEQDKNLADKITFETTLKSSSYSTRTEQNIIKSDITLALAVDFTTRGEIDTKTYANNHSKPIIQLDNIKDNLNITSELVNDVVNSINTLQIKDKSIQPKPININIAGNGIYTLGNKYTQEQIDEYVYNLLKAVLESPNLKIKVGSIRTGGQTGVDEAGAKAGARLGLSTTVLTTSNWRYKNRFGADKSGNKENFVERFNKSSQERRVPGEPTKIFNNPKYAEIFNKYMLSLDNISTVQKIQGTAIKKIFLTNNDYLEDVIANSVDAIAKYSSTDTSNSSQTETRC